MATSPETPTNIGFAELHCKSNYSFLTGASHPEELVTQAHALGYQAVAITDECSFCGIVKAHEAATKCGIQLIVGAEFELPIGSFDSIKIVLLAPTLGAYGRLSNLISSARRNATKGAYQLHANMLEAAQDCFAIWPVPRGRLDDLTVVGRTLRTRLPHLWLALELFLDGTDEDKTATVLQLSMVLDLPVVASNDVHMHIPERKPLLDTLTAIRLGLPVHKLGSAIDSNDERHLRPLETLQALYHEDMLAESLHIAQACTFTMEQLAYEYPANLVPRGFTPAQHLRQLTFAGAHERWPEGIPPDVIALLEKELKLVAELNYEMYFLTVHDIVRFARNQGILCQGRGSAANSAVCFCLMITSVDPDRIHVLFERFVSKERHEPPDIDVDFEHERREEVIQYIYRRYTRDHAALAATLITYRPRSAIRDVGKALDFDLDLIDLLAKSMSWWDKREVIDERLDELGLDSRATDVQQFVVLVSEILGFPRHLSQHVGGFVISERPLSQLVPIENAAMPDRTVIQWDKYDLETMKLMKVDVLGLGMLSAIRKAFDYANAFHGLRGADRLTLATVPPEDLDTYEMLQQGDSVGVFQVESRAQMSMLPRLKPACFYDLVIEVAIVRPGPIQGNMVHPYLKRRQGLEEITYSSPEVKKVLERTFGVPIFQEQVIELAMVAAGFTAGEADHLRRAMAAWKRKGGLDQYGQKLIDGMLARGHPREFADRIFEQIKGFGEYGFPESHAASFALLVYVSAWLKRHEPAAFYCGLLNSQPMGFYSPSQLVQDAVRHDIEILPVDVQFSNWDYHLEPTNKAGPQDTRQQGCVRVGLRQIKGLGEDAGRLLEANRPYLDIDDLARRAALSDQALTFLARAGALETLCGHRHQAHWDAAGVEEPTRLAMMAQAFEAYVTEVQLMPPTTSDDTVSDYRYLGLTLGAHPVELLRKNKVFRRCVKADSLATMKPGRFVQLMGLVTCRQRPSSATGVLFLTLEDESGNANLVVWTNVLERFRKVLVHGQLLMIKGVIDREGAVVHVIVGHAEDMSDQLEKLSQREENTNEIVHSRNFR
ncbi:MAG: error-prone DNA polymerase [Gammaproteobacteria bacterium]|nr:error-prone DNA polymerase [Gammaproteobacteria bacterium]